VADQPKDSPKTSPQFRRVLIEPTQTTPRYVRFIAAVACLGLLGGVVLGWLIVPRAFARAETAMPAWLPWGLTMGGFVVGLIVAMASAHMASRRRSQ
jgi:hypothetical protein